jgi:glycosyltransferase involved in cell wall biosynthesis
MWNGKTLSVVLPTYNEKDSIADVINGFAALEVVDEIIVVNNNAAAGTSEEVAKTVAREVIETRQGYGAAIKRGLREADTDLVSVCEPDGTFNPADLHKLLAFLPECDYVIGSRTVSTFVWEGANMGWFLQWGNWAVAKLVEILYNTSYLSDVGCTFRVMTRDHAKMIAEKSSLDGSACGLEILLLPVIMRIRLVQVPVNYHPRVGVSSVTGDLRKTIRLGLQMISLVLWMRVRRSRIRRSHPIPQRPAPARVRFGGGQYGWPGR